MVDQYIYHVGAGLAYDTPQAAVDRVAKALVEITTISQDFTIVINPGSYPGVIIPNGATYRLGGTSYRLKFKPATKEIPIIDFNKSSGTAGIDVESNNPNVTVAGLAIRGFYAGVRIGANSQYPAIQDCLLQANTYAGVMCERVTGPSVFQNIIIDGNYGILIRLCRGYAIAHNSIVLDGITRYEDSGVIGIFAQLASPIGLGRGQAYRYGNLVQTSDGPALVVFHDDLSLQETADHNLLHRTSTGTLIQILTDQFVEPAPSIYEFTNLADFKRIYNTELASLQGDPQLIAAGTFGVKSGATSLDFGVKPGSSAIAACPRNDQVSRLPGWVDENFLSYDFTERHRNHPTTIGALEGSSVHRLLGPSLAETTLIASGEIPWCYDDYVDDLFSTNLNIVHPTVDPGFFHVGTREYYLYRQKATKTLAELSWVTKVLPAVPLSGTTVYFDSKELPKDEYYLIHDRVWANVNQTSLASRGGELTIKGPIVTWSGDYSTVSTGEFQIKLTDCEQAYYLPDSYVPDGPVVVTNDDASIGDTLTEEFSLHVDSDVRRFQLTFPRVTNKFINPRLVAYEGLPLYWQTSGVASVNATHITGNWLPAAGEWSAYLGPSGKLSQAVRLGTSGAFSLQARAFSGQLADCTLGIRYLDHWGNLLADYDRGNFTVGQNWTPTGIYFNSGEAHESTEFVEPYVTTTSGNLVVDLLQVEDGARITPFNGIPLPENCTIEFETKATGAHIISDLSIAAHLNYNINGFLAIPEINARTFDLSAPAFATTLFDWKWAYGRKTCLPWARLTGKDKLQQTAYGVFHASGQITNNSIEPYGGYTIPEQLNLIPRNPSVIQGDTVGTHVVISCNDVYGNPSAFSYCNLALEDSAGNPPGQLSKRYHGLAEQLSSSVNGYLTSAGTLGVDWIPPSLEESTWVGPVPTPHALLNRGLTGGISSIDLPYEIQLLNAGQAQIVTLAGSQLPITGEQRVEVHVPTLADRFASIQTQYPPAFNTIQIWVDDVQWKESQHPRPISGYFYVHPISEEIFLPKLEYSSIEVVYTPRYTFVNPALPRKLYLYHSEIFGLTSGAIAVNYNFLVRLRAEVFSSDLMQKKIATFALIAKAPTNKENLLARRML